MGPIHISFTNFRGISSFYFPTTVPGFELEFSFSFVLHNFLLHSSVLESVPLLSAWA